MKFIHFLLFLWVFVVLLGPDSRCQCVSGSMRSGTTTLQITNIYKVKCYADDFAPYLCKILTKKHHRCFSKLYYVNNFVTARY
jgi:hypothetical protein